MRKAAREKITIAPPKSMALVGSSPIPHQIHRGPKTVSSSMIRLTVEEGTNRAA
jgi:hypothetical protein